MSYPADMKPSGARNHIGSEEKMMNELTGNSELFISLF